MATFTEAREKELLSEARRKAAFDANFDASGGSMTAEPRSLRGDLSGLVTKLLMAMGQPGGERASTQYARQNVMPLAEMTGIGGLTALDDASRAKDGGDMQEAVLNLMPGPNVKPLEKLVETGVKKAAKRGIGDNGAPGDPLPVERGAKPRSNFSLPAEPKTTPKGDRPVKVTKAAREQQQLDEATARVNEAFKPYEGATPNVPQDVFQRANVDRQRIDPAIARAISDPAVKERMMEAISRGMPLKDWYNMEQTRLMWGDVLGDQAAGTHRFNRFQDFMGPTSSQSPVDLNIGNATRWGFHDTTGTLPTETLANPKDKSFATPPPPGYGSKGQVGQFKSAMPLLQSGQPLDPIDYLKTSRYAGALKGNTANLPVDAHATRAPLMHLGDPEGLMTSAKLEKDAPAFNAQQRFAEQGGDIADLPVTWWKDAPPNAASYYALEDYYKTLAAESGLTPAQGQAASWVGNAGLTGVKSDPSMTAQQLFNRRVATQGIKRNMDPRDLLMQLMKGTGHLALGGVALGGASQLMPGEEEETSNAF